VREAAGETDQISKSARYGLLALACLGPVKRDEETEDGKRRRAIVGGVLGLVLGRSARRQSRPGAAGLARSLEPGDGSSDGRAGRAEEQGGVRITING